MVESNWSESDKLLTEMERVSGTKNLLKFVFV